MKKEIINSMDKALLKTCFAICFIFCVCFGSVWSQTGKVPPLVNVQEANQRLSLEVKLLAEQINAIEATGGAVDPELKLKLQLFTSVKEDLEKNDLGMTTFNAIAGSSNYRGLIMDDQAFQNYLAGTWDQNMTELIRILSK